MINSERKELYKLESIEALSKLATGSNLKEDFKKLVKCYLNKFEEGKNYLVVAIDDFDLNYSQTYLMLEDIRQYLIQSKIIVFIASNKKQLLNSLFDNFLGSKRLPNNKLNAKNRANKYIEKLIPISRTIELPNFIIRKGKKIIENIEITKQGKSIGSYPLNESGINNLYEFLIFYISSKVGFFIKTYDFRLNLIIPTTLREIKELLENIDDSNYDLLKKYIVFKTYNELDVRYSNIFSDLEANDLASLLSIEQFLIDNLPDSFIDKSLKEFINTTNPEHLTIGDLICLYENIEKNARINDVKVLQLVDFSRLLVSIIIKNAPVLNIKNQFIYNGFEPKLPKEYNYRRDWVKFKYDVRFKDHEHLDSIFLVYSLIQVYGDPDYKYRVSINNYFFRFFESFNKGVINPFAVFNNYFAIKSYVLKKRSQYPELSRYINEHNELFLKYLEEPAFVQDFINGISRFAQEFREKQPDYFHLIYIYLYEGGISTLNEMKIKNKVLISDDVIKSYKTFPFFKLWQQELENTSSVVRKFVNDIYESSKENPKKIDIEKRNKIILEYLNKDLGKRRTLTFFKKKIKDFDENSTVSRRIDNFYEYLGNQKVSQESKNKELQRLREFLQGVVNG